MIFTEKKMALMGLLAFSGAKVLVVCMFLFSAGPTAGFFSTVFDYGPDGRG